MTAQTIAIVGGGIGGWSAASTLREEGFDGRVVLIGDEPELPYDRPPLSKEYLRGEVSREQLLLRPEGWYEEHAVETLLGVRATELRLSDRVLALADGHELAFDRLLVATGGRPRRLRVPGAELEGVLYLRTRADADRIGAALQPGLRLAVVGGGFVGLEVAAAAHKLGVDVTVVEACEAPLERVLGTEMGHLCGALHTDAGVTLRTGCPVEAFEGRERVEGVRTAEGESIACDAVVVGVGMEPTVAWLERSGIDLADGVLVDERCETTVSGVFAAGDVARQQHPLLGSVRVEHWKNAVDQAAAAARNMLGADEPYALVPWFWSDQYDCNLQYAGHVAAWDEIVVRGNVSDRRFVAFYLEDGRVVGAFGVNAGRDVRRASKLIEARCHADPAMLADEGADLRELVDA
jgi:3-phenylpropionate/trans-cinnamate dioxygenase ferredoxin reductase subunit